MLIEVQTKESFLAAIFSCGCPHSVIGTNFDNRYTALQPAGLVHGRLLVGCGWLLGVYTVVAGAGCGVRDSTIWALKLPPGSLCGGLSLFETAGTLWSSIACTGTVSQ